MCAYIYTLTHMHTRTHTRIYSDLPLITKIACYDVNLPAILKPHVYYSFTWICKILRNFQYHTYIPVI
jgi:hypothetical protein